MPEVRIYHDDGSTETIPVTSAFRVAEQIGGMTEYRITVERSLAQAVSLTRKRDEIELVGFGRGPLVDLETGAETHTLVARSPEWYSTTVTPSDGGTLAQGDDATLIADQIARVPEWTAGSIGSFTGALTFVFNHAFPAEALRRIERNVPGELRFGDDGTVDYVDALGSDRAGSVTLSPTAGTIEERIQITEQGRTLDATHVRVLGAHEGEAQYFANLVPSDDPATYANRVDYTTSRWSDGDPRDWDRWQNKDVMAQDTIEEEAATLGAELTESYVEAETVVSGVSPRLSLGDFVRVQKPDAGLDRDMRVHRVVTRSAEGTPAGVVQEVTLSTRTVARDDVSADARDIQRFNTAFQGSSVVIQGGGGRQPVSASINAVEPFRYPDVQYEDEALVEVTGLPYRAYSSGAVDNSNLTNIEGQGFGIDVINVGESGTNEFDDNVIGSFTLNDSPSISAMYASISMYDADRDISGMQIRLKDVTDGVAYPEQDGVGLNFEESDFCFVTVQKDVSGHTFEWQVSFAEGDLALTYWYQTSGKHTHDPDPGVIEQFPDDPQANVNGELLPSNVDIIVNGSTVATDVGSGAFSTTVDLADVFQRDSFNTIEATSDTLGHIRMTPYVEAYKQIGSQ